MSSDDYSAGEEVQMKSSIDRCKPDYEAQAAAVKKKLDCSVELEAALFKFKHIVGAHSFKKISSFAEMLGGVILKKDDFSQHYEELLRQIEKEA